jgi:hydrogenase expression/formation protein HypC
MCLGLPGQVLDVRGNIARVECWGIEEQVCLDPAGETILPGDYVITHAGSVVRRIPLNEVADTIALYETILAEADHVLV